MSEPGSELRRVIEREIMNDADISIVPLGTGIDNAAWLANDELVVREAREPDTELTRREVALLEVVGSYSTLPVPEIVFADAERGVLAYRMLPGRPALDLPDAYRSFDAGSIGRFLRAIHAIPLDEVSRVVERDDDSLEEWLHEAQETFAEIRKHLPEAERRRIETFLVAPPPPHPERLTFCHNDLGAEHILVDPVTMQVTGIIDWTDAAIADPMRDLALIFRDFGPGVLERVLISYGADLSPDDHDRLRFHARCKLIEDLTYGIETDESRYVDAALAHLDWTFS